MFTNYHLIISKEEYAQKHYPVKQSLQISKIAPDFKVFTNLLKKVGGPYGWDRRPKYAAEISSLKERLFDKGSNLFLLKAFNDVAGYCFTIKRQDLTSTFNKRAVAEIENFGLLPEYTGKGFGRTFLPLVFDELFKNNDLIYLSSRSTNHPKVILFYEAMGMRVVKTENLPDDLLTDPPAWGLDYS